TAGAGGERDAATDAGRDGEAGDAGQDAAATDAGHKDAATDAQKDAETDAAPPACTNACTFGSHRCAADGSEACVLGSNGCTEWAAGTTCRGVTTCAGATGLCTCPAAPAGCTGAGKLCDSSGDLVTCTADAQGCLTASAPAACPTDTSCMGTQPNAACTCDNNASCSGTNSFCINSSTVGNCGMDSNTPACNVVVSTMTCGGSSACAGGTCICPAAGATAGTGCPTLNATACSGTDILTCVAETASGCSIWQASTHCGTNGLACGTKAGGPPACQCPDNTGTDVYVDPVAGSDVAGGLFPTGLQTPAACRYATLTNGLAKVGTPGRVIAITANPPTAFGEETFPLAVPAGVSLLTADASFNPFDYVIDYAGGPTPALTLANGTAFRGFEIVGTGAAPAMVACSAGMTTLDTVLLNGSGLITDGVDLTGNCAATLNALSAIDFQGIALNNSSSGITTMTGGLLSASQIGLQLTAGTMSVTGLTIFQNAQYGVVLPDSSAGTPILSLDQSTQLNGNGATGGGFPSIAVGKGSLTFSLSEVMGSGGPGIALSSPTGNYQITSSQVIGSGATTPSPGVSLSAGTLVSTGLTVTTSTADGVSVSGGVASLTSPTLTQNAGNGLTANGPASVTVSGGTTNHNGGAGILAIAGSLTVQGNFDVASNVTGLQLTGATTTVTSATVHDNTANGVVVNDATGTIVSIGTPSTTTISSHNGGAGILVDASPATSGSGANSLTVDTVSVTNNGTFGIYLKGDSGSVAATIKNSTISGSGDVGLLVEQGGGNTTSEAIQNDDVNGNNTGNGHTVGGVLFNTASTLASFIGNKVHSNGGDELGFNAAPNSGTSWVINPPSLACDATANSLYCYGNGHVGLNVLNGGATVDGQHVHWTNNPPTSGIDYSGTVTVTNPCSTVTAVCP
ncbi:MAG TPA: hypothetical protein VHG72_04995, partial [Polyangia bacterium]|nr:hypothetical protein [Polyangia bacterium]